MNYYFTADTHFGSERVLKFGRRPFDSVEEMDNTMINNWNSVVDPEDTVYHLGDFGDYNISKLLNGNIFLLCGNYEMDDLGISIDEFIKSFYYPNFNQNNIDLINSGCRKLEHDFNFHRVFYNCGEAMPFLGYNCTHRPVDCDKTKFNLFGHVHGLCKIKRYGLNVGTDCHNFKPVGLTDIEFFRDAIDNVYDKNVFE